MTNPMQPLDQAGANDPVTPRDTPSSPAGYASVTPHGQGPAPYNIQAGAPDLSGVFGSANATAGAGVLYAQSERQRQTEVLLSSPPGFAVGGYATHARVARGPGRRPRRANHRHTRRPQRAQLPR